MLKSLKFQKLQLTKIALKTYSKYNHFNLTNNQILIELLIYSLLNDKKYAQSIWFYDLVHEKTFRLSSRTPRNPTDTY